MKKEEYIETLVINNHMINVGLDDYGQTYFLEYLDTEGKLIQNSLGAYETDYLRYAEMLFTNPKECEFYGKDEYCQKLAHTYCGNCEKCFMCVDRDNRYLNEYGITYEEYSKSFSRKDN